MSKHLNQWVTTLLPLSFVGVTFLNILCYPLGLHAYDQLRTLLVFGLLGAVASSCFCFPVFSFPAAISITAFSLSGRS